MLPLSIERQTKHLETMKNYIHQIVKTGAREVTSVETVYTNASTPKSSFKRCLEFMNDVQYEIVNRSTNEIKIIKP